MKLEIGHRLGWILRETLSNTPIKINCYTLFVQATLGQQVSEVYSTNGSVIYFNSEKVVV